MKQLTWLHLSDWHQKGPDFDRSVVRDALIKDIRERERIDPALARVDFAVFSGDLAFSGKSAEYKAARQHLLDPLLDAAGLEHSRLFIVPGNHDLDREILYEMLPRELQTPLDSYELVQKWLNTQQRRARTLEPFEAYCKFVSQYTGQPTPDYASIVRFDAGGKRVALLGLNSAWMTARKDAKGELISDYGNILIGEPQVYDALAQIADAELRIAVVHHPFDWLKDFDRNRTEARLVRQCHFILRGHVHTPQVYAIGGTVGDCVIIPAGASYDRRVAQDPRYTNAYNWVHLDFEARRGAIYLRRWSDRRDEWIEDIESHPGGKFVLDNLPKELGKQTDIPRIETRLDLLLSSVTKGNMQTDFDNDLLAYFTDVEHLRGVFKEYVTAKTLPKRLLVIHGVGGVGKSSLLRMFRLHCKGAHVPVALASGDEAKSALDVLARWTDDLKADGVAFPAFGKTFEHYRAIQAKVDEQAKKARRARRPVRRNGWRGVGGLAARISQSTRH